MINFAEFYVFLISLVFVFGPTQLFSFTNNRTANNAQE
jgi:hypothetical protein